jgi:hypothetical protein
MEVEFDAWDIMKEEAGSWDYYSFLEDDIIIEDSWWFYKLDRFNKAVRNPQFLLLPHRYEYHEGMKYYNDQMMLNGVPSSNYRVAVKMGLSLGEVEFCQYENPHAGLYCLNQNQLVYWLQKGNKWKYQSTAYGPLESAATFNMMHYFDILKPKPNHLQFFQVRHYGAKYLNQFLAKQHA